MGSATPATVLEAVERLTPEAEYRSATPAGLMTLTTVLPERDCTTAVAPLNAVSVTFSAASKLSVLKVWTVTTALSMVFSRSMPLRSATSAGFSATALTDSEMVDCIAFSTLAMLVNFAITSEASFTVLCAFKAAVASDNFSAALVITAVRLVVVRPAELAAWVRIDCTAVSLARSRGACDA